jgi:effector-binding domain-containing protein
MQLSPVTITETTPRAFACIRTRTRMPVADVPRRFRESLDQIYAAGKPGRIMLDGQNIFTYRPTDSDDIVDVEFGVGVREPFAGDGTIVMSQLAASRTAMTTLTGDYGGIPRAHDAVIDWCVANNRRRSGTRWEIYGHWVDDVSKVETHIFHELLP